MHLILVSVQVTTLFKCFFTQITFVGALTGMDNHVPGQVVLVCKRPVALSTFVRSLSSMFEHVGLEAASCTR